MPTPAGLQAPSISQQGADEHCGSTQDVPLAGITEKSWNELKVIMARYWSCLIIIIFFRRQPVTFWGKQVPCFLFYSMGR